jgi:hypothetical protein
MDDEFHCGIFIVKNGTVAAREENVPVRRIDKVGKIVDDIYLAPVVVVDSTSAVFAALLFLLYGSIRSLTGTGAFSDFFFSVSRTVFFYSLPFCILFPDFDQPVGHFCLNGFRWICHVHRTDSFLIDFISDIKQEYK